MTTVRELHLYNLLAGVVAGRQVSVHAASEAEPFAYSDRQAIFIPQRISADRLDARNAVLGQSLLLSAGSLDTALMRSLIGRRAAARRYAWLEILRAIDDRHRQLPPAFLRHGSLHGRLPLTRTAAESLALALQKSAPIGEIPEFIGSVRPLAVLRRAVALDGMSALTGKRENRSSRTVVRDPTDDDAETESSLILKLFESSVAGGGPLSEWLKKLLGMQRGATSRKASASGGGGGEAPVARVERAWRRGVHAIAGKPPGTPAEFDHYAAAHQFSYPEWDGAHQRYRKDWVQVTEIDPQRADGPCDVSTVLVPPSRELQRQLNGLGLDFEMNRAQREGTDLDMGRLIERAIEMRLGVSGSSDNVYRASRKTRRDLGVVVLADTSGSTQEANAGGESLFHQHLRAAYQLTRTFDRLGDRIASYGFQSWGRRMVHFSRLKGHDEAWSQAVAARFAHLEPVGYTRTGAAIRHAHRVLRTSVRLPNRLLILITDGFSYDQDYEERHAEADARMALSEASAAGTACVVVCIGGAQTADKLASVFGQSNLLIVDDGRQIQGRIGRICARALAAVSHRVLRRGPVQAY
jgi:nitric oxide reductase NorD protein